MWIEDGLFPEDGNTSAIEFMQTVRTGQGETCSQTPPAVLIKKKHPEPLFPAHLKQKESQTQAQLVLGQPPVPSASAHSKGRSKTFHGII